MLRQTLATPITFSEREIFLTSSVGIVRHDPARPGQGR
jgi:hypothetical protein